MPQALKPGEHWSLDVLSDTFGASRPFRILAVNDDCCHENLCLVAVTSISGARVARELDALFRVYGKPKAIVSELPSIAPSVRATMATGPSSPVGLS